MPISCGFPEGPAARSRTHPANAGRRSATSRHRANVHFVSILRAFSRVTPRANDCREARRDSDHAADGRTVHGSAARATARDPLSRRARERSGTRRDAGGGCARGRDAAARAGARAPKKAAFACTRARTNPYSASTKPDTNDVALAEPHHTQSHAQQARGLACARVRRLEGLDSSNRFNRDNERPLRHRPRGAFRIQGCSSIGRAPVSKTGCCRFEPCRPCHVPDVIVGEHDDGPVAELV